VIELKKVFFFIFIFLAVLSYMYYYQDITVEIPRQDLVRINKTVSEQLDEDLNVLRERARRVKPKTNSKTSPNAQQASEDAQLQELINLQKSLKKSSTGQPAAPQTQQPTPSGQVVIPVQQNMIQ
jgi:hypothetical protein